MRANCARNDGFERMSLAWVVANCWRRDRKTESCASRACALAVRREVPWEANWADVRRLRSKAPIPTPFLDIVDGRYGVHGADEFGITSFVGTASIANKSAGPRRRSNGFRDLRMVTQWSRDDISLFCFKERIVSRSIQQATGGNSHVSGQQRVILPVLLQP